MSGDGPSASSGTARDTATDDDPSPRQIAAEIAIFAALFILAGAAFVLVRVLRQGTQVLDFDPHAVHVETDPK